MTGSYIMLGCFLIILGRLLRRYRERVGSQHFVKFLIGVRWITFHNPLYIGPLYIKIIAWWILGEDVVPITPC